MSKTLTIVLLTAFLAIVLYREACWPAPPKPQIPHIITKFDTVSVLPTWFADSQKIWKQRKPKANTPNLIISSTIVKPDTGSADTSGIAVIVPDLTLPPEERPNVWPILSYHGGASFGDTAIVSAFSVRDGRLGISKVFVAGILTAIEADSTSVPKMSFSPFPDQKNPSLFYRLKYILIGAAGYALYQTVKP